MHQMVSVVEEMIFVNGMVLLVIISSNINITTVKYVGKRMTVNLYKSLENINEVYYKCRMYE